MQLNLHLSPQPLQRSEVTMIIETQILHNDMDSDSDRTVGETSINSNIYISITGASPSEKAKVREILDQFYRDIKVAIRTV
jgi:hypothetical protein